MSEKPSYIVALEKANAEETTKKENSLSLEKVELLPFFCATDREISLKAEMATLEFPFFSLTKKPETEVKRYEINGGYVEFRPGLAGMPTSWDRDIMLYAIGQIANKMNRGEEYSKTIRFYLSDYVKKTKKDHRNCGFKDISESLRRFHEVTVETNIRTNKILQVEGFHLIQSWKLVQSLENENRTMVEITLSDWSFNAILGKEILTISDEYFRIKSSIKRRLYEIARKNCGQNRLWKMSIESLYSRVGTISDIKYLKRDLKKIAKQNDLPDYEISYDQETEKVTFTKRQKELEVQMTH